MKLVGIEDLTPEQLHDEVSRGGRFVLYQYCFSIIVMTFKRGSDIHFIRAGEGSVGKGMGFTVMSLFLGWWGFPWGPIYTIQSLYVNLTGGKDVTQEIMAQITAPQQQAVMARPG
jgi:hypothetical protein